MSDNKPSPVRVASRHLGTPMTKTAGEVRFIKDRGGDEKNFGWASQGPSQREITNGFEFSPKKLKPLAKTLRSTLIALGHVQSAYHDFTKIKSAVISPDGNLGGKGYIQEIREMRRQYMNVSEALSSLSDTIYDEINAPHWAVQAGEEQATSRTREDVAEIMDDVEEIRENPEAVAEDMEEKWENEPGHAKTARRVLVALSSEQEDLYDTLMLVAENDGRAYKDRKPKDAVERAFKDHKSREMDDLNFNYSKVRSKLVKDLQIKWRRKKASASRVADIYRRGR